MNKLPLNCCCQCLCPQGKFQLLPDSLGGFLISASESDLGLRVCEILCAPFKSGIFVSYSPPSLLYASPAGLSWPDILQGLSSPVQDSPTPTPRWGAQIPCSLGRSSAAVTILPSIGCLPMDVGLYCISVSPTHLTVVTSLYLQS